MFSLQNGLTHGILDKFRERFSLLKDTLDFDPEFRCDANGGNSCCFHFSIVLQLQSNSGELARQSAHYSHALQPAVLDMAPVDDR